jgi:hypothetical protein
MLTRKLLLWVSLTALWALVVLGHTGANGQIRVNDQPPNIEEIIKKFAAKESEFQEARNLYTFRQEVKIQTIGASNRATGEYLRISDILFDDKGKRSERIVRFPTPTLQGLVVTPTDLRDLADTQPFSITSKELAKYSISYVGKEKIDEIDTFVFEVKPKTIPKYRSGGERVFAGRIWVDDRDLQIVKTFGKGYPEGEERFPKFETYRENIDGKYWFPTYTYADDVLEFPNGPPIRMRMQVRYTNYKQFSSDVKIEIEGADDELPPPPKK